MKLSEKLRDMADKPYKEADRFRLRQAANEIDRLQAIMDGPPSGLNPNDTFSNGLSVAEYMQERFR